MYHALPLQENASINKYIIVCRKIAKLLTSTIRCLAVLYPLCATYENYIVCKGVDGELLPAAVQEFSGCTIVNGDLIFNFITYEQFMQVTDINSATSVRYDIFTALRISNTS